MKIEGASAATRARLAVFIREGVKRIDRLMTHGLGEEKDGGLALEKRIAFELKLFEEGKELILLEGDAGVSDIEEVRAENGRLRRGIAQRDQLLERAGINVEMELGRLVLLEAVSAPVVSEVVAVAAPPVEVVTPPAPSKKPAKQKRWTVAKKGESAPGDYVPRVDGIK